MGGRKYKLGRDPLIVIQLQKRYWESREQFLTRLRRLAAVLKEFMPMEGLLTIRWQSPTPPRPPAPLAAAADGADAEALRRLTARCAELEAAVAGLGRAETADGTD